MPLGVGTVTNAWMPFQMTGFDFQFSRFLILLPSPRSFRKRLIGSVYGEPLALCPRSCTRSPFWAMKEYQICHVYFVDFVPWQGIDYYPMNSTPIIQADNQTELTIIRPSYKYVLVMKVVVSVKFSPCSQSWPRNQTYINSDILCL